MILGAMCAAQIAWGQDPLNTWSASSVASTNGVRLNHVSFANGVFVATGARYDTSGSFLGGVLYSSLDGVSWTVRRTSSGFGLGPVVYGNGQFVAEMGSTDGETFLLSVDGSMWTAGGSTTNAATGLAYGGGQFVAVGFELRANGLPADVGTIMSSPDGVTWTTRVPSATSSGVPPGFVNVAYGNGFFVALGAGGDNSVATSTDGINWTITPNVGLYSPGGQPAMTFGNGLFVATVAGWTNVNGFMASSAVIFTSPDGLNWTPRFQHVGASGEFFSDVAYGEGQFVVVGGIYTSADGTNWVVRNAYAPISAITFGGGRFVGLAGGSAWQSGVIGKLGASLSPSGGVQGTITGVTGQNYAIEASTNNNTWGLLTNVTVNTNGLAQFSDPTNRTSPQRFYRARLAQP